jgi:hypothetical protein
VIWPAEDAETRKRISRLRKLTLHKEILEAELSKLLATLLWGVVSPYGMDIIAPGAWELEQYLKATTLVTKGTHTIKIDNVS